MERPTNSTYKDIQWPSLESAENLQKFNGEEDRRVAMLALYEKRRINNMPPPSFREIGTYLGGLSTSIVTYMSRELVEKGYLNNWSEGTEIATRNTTLRVDFGSIKLKNGEFADITKFKDEPGLTEPVKNS